MQMSLARMCANIFSTRADRCVRKIFFRTRRSAATSTQSGSSCAVVEQIIDKLSQQLAETPLTASASRRKIGDSQIDGVASKDVRLRAEIGLNKQIFAVRLGRSLTSEATCSSVVNGRGSLAGLFSSLRRISQVPGGALTPPVRRHEGGERSGYAPTEQAGSRHGRFAGRGGVVGATGRTNRRASGSSCGSASQAQLCVDGQSPHDPRGQRVRARLAAEAIWPTTFARVGRRLLGSAGTVEFDVDATLRKLRTESRRGHLPRQRHRRASPQASPHVASGSKTAVTASVAALAGPARPATECRLGRVCRRAEQ